MGVQLKRGHLKFLSVILLDLLCLVIANVISAYMYLSFSVRSFSKADYMVAIVYMMVIDVLVTLAIGSMNRVLKRGMRSEVVESVKHVALSFVLLALVLFSTKQGSAFSRMTVYLAYTIYLVLIVITHTIWKKLLRHNRSTRDIPSVLLVTTAGYAEEGLGVVQNAGMTVKAIFITDKTNEGSVHDIPTIVERQDAIALLCWEWIDKVYICGTDNIDVPEDLLTACKQLGIIVYTAPAHRRLDYEVIRIRTALSKNDKTTGLSFFEGEHDIPFKISCLYSIFENEQEKQTGFHAHKQSWHLFFCPYGSIDVMVDTGRERKTVSLSDPSTGLILHPSIWREIVWKKTGSVLCVATSGHYDAEKLRNDYREYLKFLQEREWSATIESAEILGETA